MVLLPLPPPEPGAHGQQPRQKQALPSREYNLKFSAAPHVPSGLLAASTAYEEERYEQQRAHQARTAPADPMFASSVALDPEKALPGDRMPFKLVKARRSNIPNSLRALLDSGPATLEAAPEEAPPPSLDAQLAQDTQPSLDAQPSPDTQHDEPLPLPQGAPPLPLLRNRERVALLKRSPLFTSLPETSLQRLAAAASEKEVPRYQTLRPLQSLFVNVEGELVAHQGAHMPLTLEMSPDLLTTAPDLISASAATAVALDGAVAGKVSDPGATLGLPALVGGLVAAPPTFNVMAPSLLLQLPLAAVQAEVRASADLERALGVESRLRMLLATKAVREASAPPQAVRQLAAVMKLISVPAEQTIFEHGATSDRTLILIHGRVDLVDGNGNMFNTVDARMTPPLGELPIATPKGAATSAADADDPPTQPYEAVAAEPCLLLAGGVSAAEALSKLLARGEGVAVPEVAEAEEVMINKNAPPRAMNLLQALAVMQTKIQESAPSPSALQQAAGGTKLKALMAFGGAKAFKGFGTNLTPAQSPASAPAAS